ncbi:MAG: hypothetical protein WB615_02165 [Candidatus Tumulicola sp.]
MKHAFMIAALAAAALGINAAAIAAAPPAGLPAGVQQVSPCVPGMGEHWANPKDLPFGPIYGVYNGKVVFTEVMIDQTAFAAGKSWTDQLKPIAGHTIDHVDIEFQPKGHPGYEIPHYDVHAYFVPHAVHTAYCPHGAP